MIFITFHAHISQRGKVSISKIWEFIWYLHKDGERDKGPLKEGLDVGRYQNVASFVWGWYHLIVHSHCSQWPEMNPENGGI